MTLTLIYYLCNTNNKNNKAMKTINELKEQYTKYDKIDAILIKMFNADEITIKEWVELDNDLKRKWNGWKRAAINAIAKHSGMSKEEANSLCKGMNEADIYYSVLLTL